MDKIYFEQLTKDVEFRNAVINDIHKAVDDVLADSVNPQEVARLLNNYAALIHHYLPNLQQL